MKEKSKNARSDKMNFISDLYNLILAQKRMTFRFFLDYWYVFLGIGIGIIVWGYILTKE